MKSFKFLPVAALFGCYVFGSGGAIAAQPATISICPAGGGACANQPYPASSYTDARSVDMTVRPVPVDPSGPPGSYCGWARRTEQINPEGMSTGYTFEAIPCQGYGVMPAAAFISPYVAPTPSGCPAGYSSVAFSSIANDATFSCLKL